MKVLRLEENCLEITALTPKIMKESKIALFAVEGNVFDMKMFTHIDGYDQVSKILVSLNILYYFIFIGISEDTKEMPQSQSSALPRHQNKVR